jgi:hypothetical protein
MKASHWGYLAEGGEHAVFFFQGDGDSGEVIGGGGGGASHGNGRDDGKPAASDRPDSLLPLRRDWHGRLLRVRKRDLRDAPRLVATTVAVPERRRDRDGNQHGGAAFPGPPPAGPERSSEGDTFLYVRNVVAPALAPFVDVPESIHLGWEFLAELRNQTVQTADLASLRQKDWGLLPDGDGPKGGSDAGSTGKGGAVAGGDTDAPCPRPFARAMVVRDYRTVLPRPLAPGLMSCITIEVKPKAGYLAFSPLVDPAHRIKYRQSRFVSLQQLHQRGQWIKGWTNTSAHGTDHGRAQIPDDAAPSALSNPTRMSRYNPLDLFSGSIDGDPVRLRGAITQLLKEPQNNLRIWYNNRLVLGHGGHVPTASLTQLYESVCEGRTTKVPLDGKLSPSILSKEDEMHDIMEGMLFQVFSSREGQSLLSKLLVLQKLDVLDVDGATYVYQRMVDKFCGGSHQHAQRLLDDVQLRDVRCGKPGTAGDVPLFEASPFDLNEDGNDVIVDGNTCSALIECCTVIQEFQRELSRASPSLPSSACLDETRENVARIVDDLSFTECRFLLLNWLLSLATCDVSIFITLQERIIDDLTDTVPIIEVSVGDTIKQFMFCLHVIDCDRKPAKKLQNRSSKEAAFRLLPAID